MKRYWAYEVRRLDLPVEEGRSLGLTAEEILRLCGPDSKRVVSGKVLNHDTDGSLRTKLKGVLDDLCDKDNSNYYLIMAKKPNKRLGQREDKVAYLFDPKTKKGYLEYNNIDLNPELNDFFSIFFS